MTFRSRFYAAIVSLGFLATGCMGYYAPPTGDDDDTTTPPGEEPPPTVNPGEDPKPLFVQNVQPVLEAKCGTAACHSGAGVSPIKFLPADTATTYDVVTGYEQELLAGFDENLAPLVTIVVGPPAHYTTYTDAELTTVKQWIAAEYEFRTGQPTPPPGDGTTPPKTPGQISKELQQEWSGCMSLTIWQEEGVADAWANKGTNEGLCRNCHGTGGDGFLASNNDELVFNVITTDAYYMRSYFTPDVISDPANPKMIINRDRFLNVGNAEYPHIEHPRFNVDGDAMDRLQRFYDRTMQRKANGECDPPRLTPPQQ